MIDHMHAAARKPAAQGSTPAPANPTAPPRQLDYVQPPPGAVLTAWQMAQLVKRPFASMVSQQLVNFGSAMSAYAQCYPDLEGTRRVPAQAPRGGGRSPTCTCKTGEGVGCRVGG